MAQQLEGKLVKGQYKRIHRNCAIYFLLIVSRWWFELCPIVSPLFGEDVQFDEHINHQPVIVFCWHQVMISSRDPHGVKHWCEVFIDEHVVDGRLLEVVHDRAHQKFGHVALAFAW